LPPIIEFNQETAQKIFGGQIKSHLLLFLSTKEGHFEKFVDNITPVAKEFRGKVNLTIINEFKNFNKINLTKYIMFRLFLLQSMLMKKSIKEFWSSLE